MLSYFFLNNNIKWMKKIIITAAPNKSSFTHAIANSIVAKNSDVEIIDLYSDEYKLTFLDFQNKREMEITTWIKKIQDKIKESDEIIFVFPVWWGNMPAIMKNMFDSVFVSGFAFEYWAEWKKDLLTNKKWSVIATCDAPANIYLENSDWTGINLKTYFKKSLFWFCGIQMNDFKLFWELRASSLEDKENFLKSL